MTQQVDDKSLENFEKLVDKVKPIFAGVLPTPVVTTINFVTGLIFLFTHLDLEIQAKLAEAREDLDKKVMLPRLPINSPGYLVYEIDFFLGDSPTSLRRLYPRAHEQLQRVLRDFRYKGNERYEQLRWENAHKTLRTARWILDEVYYDNRFEGNPFLDVLCRKYLSGSNPNYLTLILEIQQLEPLISESVSRNDVKKAISSYAKEELNKLTKEQREITEQVGKEIETLVWEAFIGKNGVVEKTTNLYIAERLEQIGSKLQGLEKEKAAIENKKSPNAEEKKKLEHINKEIDDLEKEKKQLEDLKNGDGDED